MERSNLSKKGRSDPDIMPRFLDVKSSSPLQIKRPKPVLSRSQGLIDRRMGPNNEVRLQPEIMEALLLDSARLEARANKLGAKDSKELIGFRDWMAFQKAQYYETSAVLYYKDDWIQKAVGAILFVRYQGRVKWLWDDEYLAESKQDSLRQLWLSFLARLLDEHDRLFDELWQEESVSHTELQQAEMVWLYHFQKGFVPISRVLPEGRMFAVEEFLHGPVARMMHNL